MPRGAGRSFEKTCATCHKLHGSGAAVGPDLTGAERKNRELLVQNIVDPSAVIRQEFMSHVAVTKDGQVLTGLLAESTADTITLVDSKNQRTVLKRSDLEELKESPVSLMPEKLLDDLTDQQIRDLVAYLQTENDVPSQIKSPWPHHDDVDDYLLSLQHTVDDVRNGEVVVEAEVRKCQECRNLDCLDEKPASDR